MILPLFIVACVTGASMAVSVETCEADENAETETSSFIQYRVHPQIAVGQQLTWASLPAHLQGLGRKLFGSDVKTTNLMNNASSVQAMQDDGFTFLMVAHSQDNTLPRLIAEMNGDRYSVRSVSKKDGLIIDIGSNIGDMAILSSKVHPTMQIVAFEPVPTTYFFLRLNLWLNNIPELLESDMGPTGKSGVLALNSAVTSDGRQVEVSWSEKGTQNAAVDTHESSVADWNRANISSVVIPDFLQKHNIDHVRLFKIDCEGCEFEVISAMPKLFTDKVRIEHAVGEIHQSLRTNTETFAIHPPAKQLQAFDDVLNARGCSDQSHDSWILDC